MNYIVFDLEWNQCPYGKDRENKRLPFEIIEFGAVKLDENREVIDKFQRIEGHGVNMTAISEVSKLSWRATIISSSCNVISL